jgi:sugar/nucleoside kinase (ribokinase family)
MASPSTRQDLKALHRLVNQADLVLATIPDPHPSIASARESLNAALALSKYLAKHEPDAAALGAKGGKATLASRGPEYFKRISAMRKKKAGGRPRKQK